MKLRSALCVAAALLAACGVDTQAPAATPDESSSAVSNIIGGFDAKSASLNAIGTVGVVDESGQYYFFCTATLIGPSTVLTAKHCAMVTDDTSPLFGMKLVNLEQIFFAVGPDANSPVKVVEAIAADLSPVEQGGFVGLGNDVAIYHLVEPITDVTPVKVADAPLSDKQIGTGFVSIGYGSKDNFEDLTGWLSATRAAGKSTLRALEGKSFELMLGSFDVFYKQMVREYGIDIVTQYIDLITSWYNDTAILKDYEVWTGYAKGDAQTCHGDSGGPLLGKEGNEKKIFGVVSGGWHSTQLTCDYGTFYAAIGNETRTMITEALKYQDPCAGGITAAGQCNGDVATRCSDKWEGDRRLSQIDCSLLDQTCAMVGGRVACVDADGTVSGEGTVTKGKAPTLVEIRKQAFSRARSLPVSKDASSK